MEEPITATTTATGTEIVQIFRRAPPTPDWEAGALELEESMIPHPGKLPGLLLRSLAAGLALSSLTFAVPPAQVTELDATAAEEFAVGEFSFVDSSGAAIEAADLLGEPWVGVLFFTSCGGPCPRLIHDVNTLLAPELEGTDVRIVALTVDPETDTPEVLTEYADRFELDPARWLLLTGAEEELHRFMREGLKLAVEDPREGGSAAERLARRLDITHSTRLAAVDRAGHITGWYEVGTYADTERAEVEAAFARAAQRLLELDGGGSAGGTRSILPAVNASLNGLAFLLLMWGYSAIRSGKRELHGKIMGSAFLVSAAFLACYLYYHFVVLPISGGPTRFNGEGFTKGLYLALLASHVILAAVNLPMVLRTFFLAHREDWERHKRMARWTFPIWVYVSVTGVLVYVVLYHLNPPAA